MPWSKGRARRRRRRSGCWWWWWWWVSWRLEYTGQPPSPFPHYKNTRCPPSPGSQHGPLHPQPPLLEPQQRDIGEGSCVGYQRRMKKQLKQLNVFKPFSCCCCCSAEETLGSPRLPAEGLSAKSQPADCVAAAPVFSLCIFESVFPLADLCLGAAKIKRAFWWRPGCLRKCRNAL